MKLSILDQLTVPKNQSASDTLQEAKELAQLAENLVTQEFGMPNITAQTPCQCNARNFSCTYC